MGKEWIGQNLGGCCMIRLCYIPVPNATHISYCKIEIMCSGFTIMNKINVHVLQ